MYKVAGRWDGRGGKGAGRGKNWAGDQVKRQRDCV